MPFNQTQVVKGALVRIEGRRIVNTFRFQYNPTTARQSNAVQFGYTEAPGQFLPVATFTQIGEIRRSLELFLYSREEFVRGSTAFGFNVKKMLAELELFTMPGPRFDENNPQFVAPTTAKLVMGDRVWNVVIDNMDTVEERFDSLYQPIQARVTINMRVISKGQQTDLAYLNQIRSRAGLSG